MKRYPLVLSDREHNRLRLKAAESGLSIKGFILDKCEIRGRYDSETMKSTKREPSDVKVKKISKKIDISNF